MTVFLFALALSFIIAIPVFVAIVLIGIYELLPGSKTDWCGHYRRLHVNGRCDGCLSVFSACHDFGQPERPITNINPIQNQPAVKRRGVE